MQNWTNPFDLEDADYLTVRALPKPLSIFIVGLTCLLPRTRRVQVQGEHEHYEMAKRALAFYKDLLGTCPFEVRWTLCVLRAVPCVACCASLLTALPFPAALALRYPLDRDLARGHERQRLQLRSV